MFKYDPHLKTEKEIRESFTSGRRYMDAIITDLTPINGKLSNQCILITGKRGMGKSHFLNMLYYRIMGEDILKNCYFPILFPEELYKVNSLYHLVRDAIDRIISGMPIGVIQDQGTWDTLTERYKEICLKRFKGSKKEQILQREELEKGLFTILKNMGDFLNKKFVFLLENLNDLFVSRLTRDELKRLRAFLQQNDRTLLIIGTALSVFNRVEKYGEPFHNFFQLRNLDGLTSIELIDFLKTEARLRDNPGVLKQIEKSRGEIEVYRILTGGNPRLCLFLYDLLSETNELVIEDILKKITEITPYFKAMTEKLSPSKQIIIDALCEGAPARTPSQIADHINEKIGIVNENLKRLSEEGMVEIIDMKKGKKVKKSETFYRIRDYLYRVWYQMRSSVSGSDNLSWMAELATILFKESDLEERLKINPDRLKPVYERALTLVRDENYMERLRYFLPYEKIRTSPNEYKDKLIHLYEKKDWKGLITEAETQLNIGIHPDFALFSIGVGYSSLGQHEKAIEAYQKAIGIKPDSHTAWNNMGNNYAESGQYEKAIEAYQKAFGIKPDYYEAWNNMGISYAESGQHEKAIEAYQKAIEIKPDMHEAWSNMGFSYTELGQHEKAIEAYQKAIEIKPDKHEAWYNMGFSYTGLGQHEKAIEAYQKAVEIKPDMHEAWYNMGFSYTGLGQHEKAIEAYQKAVEIKPDMHEAWYNMGISYAELGQQEKAIEAYQKAIEIKPDRHEAWYNMGSSYADSGQYEKAIEAYRKCIIYAPNFPSFTLKSYRKIKNGFGNLFKKKEAIRILVTIDSSLKEKIKALGEVICLDQFNGIETIAETVFDEMDKAINPLPQQELKILYFYLMFETILRLNKESSKGNPIITGRYLLKTMHILDDNRSIDDKIMEFVINYIQNTEEGKINKKELLEIFEEWEQMDVYLPEVVPVLIEAIEDPDSRTAQVWAADPLFKEILIKIRGTGGK